MSERVLEVSDATFEDEVLKAGLPVVVDFWAPWCAPCRVLAPVVEKLAERYDGNVLFYKLNIDENGSSPQRYAVKGIPTLIVFDAGREVERVVGAVGLDALARTIDKYVPVSA
jgi:thioredoxin 1